MTFIFCLSVISSQGRSITSEIDGSSVFPAIFRQFLFLGGEVEVEASFPCEAVDELLEDPEDEPLEDDAEATLRRLSRDEEEVEG